VLDHVGNTLRLGHHLEERDWTLDGLRKRDREAAPSVKVCPQCFATSPSTAQVCTDCGHVFAPPERREIKVVEGELVEHSTIKVGDYVRFKDPKAMMESPETFFVNDMCASKNVVTLSKVQHPKHRPIVTRLDRIEIDPRRSKIEQGKATDLEALRELAQQRGYKRGWAERVYQARLAKRHGI
jgi:hypothetical protein